MADDQQHDVVHARQVRMRARRARWIARFRQQQAERRDWLNVGEIVMWSAGVPGGFTSREIGYDWIIADLLAGRLDRLICLHRDRLIRLTPTRMQDLLEMVVGGGLPRESIREEYLNPAWIQQSAFERWRSRYHLPEPPAHFRPPSPSRGPVADGATA
jgi:hypothetical protein